MAKKNKPQAKNIRLYNRTRKTLRELLTKPDWTQARILKSTTIKGATLSRIFQGQHVARKATLEHVATQLSRLEDFPVPVATKARKKSDNAATDAVVLNLEERLASLSREALIALRNQIEKLNKVPDLQAEVESLRKVNAAFSEMNTELREMSQLNAARVAELLKEVLKLRGKR